METISLSNPINYTSASSKLIRHFENLGIRTVKEFLEMDHKSINELNVDHTTLFRLIRESIIINENQIPIMYPIDLRKTIFIDFHWISKKKPRIWYIGIMNNFETRYFVNYDGLEEEKYVLQKLNGFLSKHASADIILIPKSQSSTCILANRMDKYELDQTNRIKGSRNWSFHCSSILLWGYSTSHNDLLRYISQIPSNCYNLRGYYDRKYFDILRKGKFTEDTFSEVAQKSNKIFGEIIDIIENMILIC